MRRIALVTPMFPVPHDKTRGRYIYETARSLSELATVKVYFQQLRYPSLPYLKSSSYLYGRLDSSYSVPDVDVEAQEVFALPGISRPLNGEVIARHLYPRMKAFRPDVVLGYWLYPDGYAAVRAARRLNVPSVVGALGSDIHVQNALNQWFIRRTVARADAMLTVSEHMRATAITNYALPPDKVHAVVNGYNSQVFYPRPQVEMRKRLGIPADQRLVIYVGRFVRAKGLVELVNAFATLAARDTHLRLVLVGDGVMRDELDALLKSQNLVERTLLPGGLEPPAVAEWICASDLLCLPSWSEGYPNVVIEAAACGRPVVATDVGGTSEIVGKDNGILVPARDEAALAGALRTVLGGSWDPLAIARTVKRSWNDVARETLEVCESVVRARYLP